jgi:hypothetical protein
LYEEFSNKSVEFAQSLRDMPYGKEFYVADPDANIIAFLEEHPFKADHQSAAGKR